MAEMKSPIMDTISAGQSQYHFSTSKSTQVLYNHHDQNNLILSTRGLLGPVYTVHRIFSDEKLWVAVDRCGPATESLIWYVDSYPSTTAFFRSNDETSTQFAS